LADIRELDRMFKPSSVAVVGASPNPKGWGGTNFVQRLIKLEFPGNLYPINPKAQEVLGLKAYPKVSAIPEPVDLVTVAISAPGVPSVLEDCIAAGVKNVHIFASGFGETGEEEGKQLEKQILEIIDRGKLNVVGPNCMGLYVPASKLAAWGAKPEGAGNVAFVSQSGGHGEILSVYGQSLGIHFSKMISFGNACGLQVTDFLEYLGQDRETEIIALYLEGMKEGNKFTQLVKEINQRKPVIVWKGGLTSSGSKAIASHTGSMAGETKIWDAFFAQTGAVRAYSLEEMMDVVLAFNHMNPLTGCRTLLLGGGGGNSVAFADTCSREGLDVPPLSEGTRQELNTFIRLAGNSTRNPLDIWMVQREAETYRRVMELSMADPNIDLAIVDRLAGGFFDFDSNGEEDEDPEIQEFRDSMEEINNFLKRFAQENRSKPFVVTTNMYGGNQRLANAAEDLRREFLSAGIPAYITLTDAARAISRFIKYHEFQAAKKE